MTYQTIANKIIRESIKSAVFIDEKALSFYEKEKTVSIPYEEELSKALYENFKANGISLAIHKFVIGNEKETNIIKYLFDDRDLVLLDWKLDGEEGEGFSLKLLSNIVNRSNIHFCVIYTSDSDLTRIYASLLSYFSGRDNLFYSKIKDKFEAYEDVLLPIFSKFNLFNLHDTDYRRIIGELNRIDFDFVKQIREATSASNAILALKHLKYSFENYPKADSVQPEPEYELLSFDQKTLVINNTIITIVNKENNASLDAEFLIKKFSDQISLSKNSFTQLLGLEMQTTFSAQSSFIDSSLLKVSKEALLKHRTYLIDREKTDMSFKSLIKNVLIEHATMSLRSADLSLLDDNFLNHMIIDRKEDPSDASLMAMNVFYNSVKLNRLNHNISPVVNFGDVFVNECNEYFICITALCDCLRPDKIKSNYFFAKGTPIDKDLALRLGDSAFISFLSENIVVSWVTNNPNQADISQKYIPVYIKPLTYNIKQNGIKDNKIEIRRLITIESNEIKDNGDFDWLTLDYVTTIRPNYAQRIANHAFTHPVRVGVEFVKKD